MKLFERLCTTFLHTMPPLVSDGGYYSSEDVFTALPYAKGRRYFDAVALSSKRINPAVSIVPSIPSIPSFNGN